METRLERRRQAVVALIATGLAVLTAAALAIAGGSLTLVSGFMDDDFLFLFGLILTVLLLPLAALPLALTLGLWRSFARMVRGGSDERVGLRLAGIEIAAGISLAIAGASLYPDGYARLILFGGLAVFGCALAAFWLAARPTPGVCQIDVEYDGEPDTPRGRPGGGDQAWHIDLTKRRGRP